MGLGVTLCWCGARTLLASGPSGALLCLSQEASGADLARRRCRRVWQVQRPWGRGEQQAEWRGQLAVGHIISMSWAS